MIWDHWMRCLTGPARGAAQELCAARSSFFQPSRSYPPTARQGGRRARGAALEREATQERPGTSSGERATPPPPGQETEQARMERGEPPATVLAACERDQAAARQTEQDAPDEQGQDFDEGR